MADDPDIMRAFAVLGMCAANFAALELRVQLLLSLLRMRREPGEGAVGKRRTNFYQNISLLAKLIQCHLSNQPKLLTEGISLTKELHHYREKRNLFIHGSWLVDRTSIMQGFLIVGEAHWDQNRDATSLTWNHINMPLVELELLPKQIGELIERLNKLTAALEVLFQP